MGKIFKALEKADKKNGAKPAPQSTGIRAHPEIETVETLPKAEPVVKTDLHARMTEKAYRENVPPEVRKESNSSARSNKHAPSHPSPSVTESKKPSTKGKPVRRPEKYSPQDIERPEKRSVKAPAEVKSVPQPDTNPKVDGVNIALVKQDAPEPLHTIKRLDRKPEDEEIKVDKAPSLITTSGKRVRVQYSRTKVQINDPDKLKNNNVLSIFEDMETTNEFKLLRTQVLKKLKRIKGNSILVTSANPYEGKTFTSINLGVSIAKEFDRTVLIIDADMRRPTRYHTDFSTAFFSLKVEDGLTDYLEGDVDIEDILINPGIDKLTLIPGGRPIENSAELLNSARMESMMLEIKSRYPSDRLVIVDGPAFLHFPDAMILCRYVDGVLPVIESEKTPSEDVKKMMNHLQEFNILGVVLNKNKG